MSKKKHRRHAAGERRGYTSGAYGVSYAVGGYYLSPAQFGYTTAQADSGGDTTTTGGTDGAGDGSGGTA